MADDDADRRAALQRVSDAEREKVAERIRAAAADGRLGLDELDDRLGSALAARTRGDLDAVVADLGDDGAARPAAEPVVIRADGSAVERTGRWVAPPRLTVKASMSSVVLDFTDATFAAAGCRVEVELSGSSLRLVVPEDVAADVDVETRFSSVDVKVPDRPADPRAVVQVTGATNMSSVSVRRPGWRRRRQLRKAQRRRALEA
ncbi:DUF1707 SHOCT-like domain-containing protein [Jiangella rhizosphaerae]|uniref:DUF1707 domain-containing protein n=1 Tax=Jiangella rhizosphaerae TaxID=2293569 RepID=A0A418KUF8_9ACTN|nr:DUF1707 domain-containing protein [Jiangella rhizosphaerae]RIQ32491.1 DUF1707 domain-containing protein [Jiangella rhizosphaerae]